jgi:hypothetical protein
MTHQRVAACGHRTCNAGFLARNPGARPSQPDPDPPVGFRQSCPTLSLSFSSFASTKQSLVTSSSRPSAGTQQRPIRGGLLRRLAVDP